MYTKTVCRNGLDPPSCVHLDFRDLSNPSSAESLSPGTGTNIPLSKGDLSHPPQNAACASVTQVHQLGRERDYLVRVRLSAINQEVLGSGLTSAKPLGAILYPCCASTSLLRRSSAVTECHQAHLCQRIGCFTGASSSVGAQVPLSPAAAPVMRWWHSVGARPFRGHSRGVPGHIWVAQWAVTGGEAQQI